MKHTVYKMIQKSFLRNAFCLAAIIASMPAVAQYEVNESFSESEQVETPKPLRRQAMPKENYEMKTIKGLVMDEASKSPLAGIQVRMLGNNRYTAMSDDDGTFVIKVPVFATALYVHSSEFLAQQVAIPSDTTRLVQIFMLSDKYKSMYTDETTYTAKRGFTSTAVQNLTIDQEIAERLGADVRSVQRSGQLAIGNNVFIRGLNSINASSQPLILVDGVEVDLQLGREALHNGFTLNELSTLMTADIDNVTVLKNATALYGARGANGVILIETKRGHSMATRIDADLSLGISLVPQLPKMMNASQYRIYATEMMGTIEDLRKDMPVFNFLNDDNSKSNYYYHDYHNNTDWADEVYREAITQNYSINVQGGDNVGMYNLSVGYADGKNTMKGMDFNRMNVRFNTDINIIPILDTKFNLSIARTTSLMKDDGALEDFSQSTPTSPGFLALIKSPLLSPYQWNSNLNGGNGAFSSSLSLSDDAFLSGIGVLNTALANPVGILKEADADYKNNIENMNFRVMLEPTLKLGRDFKLTSAFSYSLTRNSQRYFRPTDVVPGFVISRLGTVYAKYATLFSKEGNVLSNTHLDYSHIFGAHSLKAFAGFRLNFFTFDSDIASTQFRTADAVTNKSPKIDASTSHYYSADGHNDVWKQLQWYGNVDYNYMNRYFVTLSLLGEANSRFGKNAEDGMKLFGVKWALFPSVQAGWVLTNESWFPKNAGVNYLRIHAGYDISGNDDINNIAARTLYTMVKYNNLANGLQLTNIGNDKIQWETTHKVNIGFEANLLHNRIGIGFDYFHHTTKNLLTLMSFEDQISGIDKYWTNGGELQNQGFEAQFSVKPVVTKSWTVEVGASVGHYQNKVTQLPDGDYTSSVYGDNNIITLVGSPIALFYGYKTDGVLKDDAAAREAAKAAGKDDYLYMLDETGAKQYFKSGDVHFVDLNNDGMIDESDKTVIGDPNPDVYGNIFAKVTWKNLTLAANFNYSLGNDVYNYQRMLLNSGSNFWNQQVATTKHWRYEGQVTDMPRIAYGDPMQNNRFSDRWIEDGSYLRLKTLTLSYKIPIVSSYLQGLTVYGEARNLFTLSRYLGSDPEFSINSGVMYQGIDAGNLAQSRSFTLGVKVNL